jgi:hypothetical protein
VATRIPHVPTKGGRVTLGPVPGPGSGEGVSLDLVFAFARHTT